MAKFSVELSNNYHPQHCDCCGKDQITVWGMVYRDGVANCVYYAYMHPHESSSPERMLSLTISMGSWAENQEPPNRDWIQLKVRHDFQMMVRDADEAVLFGKEFLGRPMTREQALSSPLIGSFFAVADFVVFQDPAINSFLAGKNIELQKRTPS